MRRKSSSKLIDLSPKRKRAKPKHLLKANEEFVDYKFVELPDGSMKRKKIIKQTNRRTKYLT